MTHKSTSRCDITNKSGTENTTTAQFHYFIHAKNAVSSDKQRGGGSKKIMKCFLNMKKADNSWWSLSQQNSLSFIVHLFISTEAGQDKCIILAQGYVNKNICMVLQDIVSK